jgi:transcriptional regulator with XRE-family HTH domain
MNQEKIGKFIAECRKEKKITQEQLAVQLGVTSKSISKWENGNCLPDAAKYKPLCEILGITVNELFSGERLNSETENEAKDYLVDLLASRIYDVDCGVSYEDFKNALLRMSETSVMLSRFKSKETAVEYLAKETGLTLEECSNAYDFYFELYKIKPTNS